MNNKFGVFLLGATVLALFGRAWRAPKINSMRKPRRALINMKKARPPLTRPFKAFQLPVTGGCDAFLYFSGRFSHAPVRQFFIIDMWHLDKDVDPVDRRALDVAGNGKPGWAGRCICGTNRRNIRRDTGSWRHQHETRRKSDSPLGAADRHNFVLQRLAQHLEQRLPEFR